MKERLKSGFYAGLGAGLLLKDEIMKRLNAPISVTDKPAREMKERLRETLSMFSDKLGRKVDAAKQSGEEELTGLLLRIGLTRAKDVQALKDRIAELERKLRQSNEE